MLRLKGRPAAAVWAASAMVLAGLSFSPAARASDELAKREFNVVGSWSNGSVYPTFEQPFWTEGLPKASGGRLTAKVQAFDRVGLGGAAVFEMVQKGIYDIGATVIEYVAGEEPRTEGLDLPAIADPALSRKVLDAYRPHLAEALEDAYDVVLLAVLPQTPQVVFCNAKIAGLKDLAGKRVRGSGRMTMDFIEAVGGTGVSIAFNEVPIALERRVIDCGVTGALSGYTGGWSEVVTHFYALPVGGWDHIGIVANRSVWNSLGKPTQQFLSAQLADMESRSWGTIKQDFELGIACNTGGACAIGKPFALTRVDVSEEDQARALKIMEANVLPRWAARCKGKCIENWNASAGKVLGITARRG
jgi:TRAP-type C4-dicarboxylate transport system substrate-binding protein